MYVKLQGQRLLILPTLLSSRSSFLSYYTELEWLKPVDVDHPLHLVSLTRLVR